MFTSLQYVEIFHLIFLKTLEKNLEKSLYSLKGGCNLRFFFNSIRYSEDIDFDVKIIAKETLRSKITKLLKMPSFRANLLSKNIEIFNFSETKQTDTTQRWKISLNVPNSHLPLPTKIEFSRRLMEESGIFEFVSNEIIQQYRLYPILTSHYSMQAAFFQKINALIHRTETQARDVFDLQLLLDKGANIQTIPIDIKKNITTALENLQSVQFIDFKGQVVAYLMPEYQDYYGAEAVWNKLKMNVAHALQGRQS